MKYKVIKYFFFVVLVGIGTACSDMLDNEIDTNLRPEQVYVNYDRMKQVAVGAYTNLQVIGGFYQWETSLKACATDEAEETNYSSQSQKFNMGIWNQYSNPEDVYAKLYVAIRQCNLFLENSVNYKKILVTDTITTVGKENYLQQCEDIAFYRNEVRFLRALYYFELIKRYGGVPLVTRTLSLDEGKQIGRSTFDQCVAFIVSECDDIKDNMQVDWYAAGKPEDDGRATKGAVLALKSRVLLYAASPLNNPQNDIEKWKEAAKAANEVMQMKKVGSMIKPLYQLSNNYQNLFLAPNSYSDDEVIFYIRYANSNILEAWNYPIGTPGGSSGVTPTQNLVDAYDKLDGWDPSRPYDRVDPRMQYTIVVNNSTWNGRKIECYTGGKDGVGQRNASRTGYYLKKFLSPNLDLTGTTPGRSMKAWIMFRYAEILLNYAEAMNEAFGPNGTSRGDGLTLSARAAVNQVRQRDGVKVPNIPNVSAADLTEAIHKERQVELAFEDHRAWDLRRWEKASLLGEPIRGVTITKTGDETFTYDFNRIVETRVFEDKMYLYPIPQSELNKYGGTVMQNPGW